MGLMDRLNRLDERAGVIDHNATPIPARSVWRELFSYPLAPWLLVVAGAGAAAGWVFEPLGVIVAVLLSGILIQRAAQRVRTRKQEIKS